MNEQQGMTIIVKTVMRVMIWMIMVYGAYLILHGHLTPGGGFGGGVIIALALLGMMLAYGRKFTAGWINIHLLHDLESTAVLLFLVMGILGLGFGSAFLMNFMSKGTLFHLLSAGTIPILNILIGIKVGLSLFLIIWVLSELRLQKGGQA